MKKTLPIIAILMVLTGFGMSHSVSGTMEIVSLMLTAVGVVILLILLLMKKRKNN